MVAVILGVILLVEASKYLAPSWDKPEKKKKKVGLIDERRRSRKGR